MNIHHPHYIRLPNLSLVGLGMNNQVTKQTAMELASLVGIPTDALPKFMGIQTFGADHFEQMKARIPRPLGRGQAPFC
jgi:hypothetical protein